MKIAPPSETSAYRNAQNSFPALAILSKVELDELTRKKLDDVRVNYLFGGVFSGSAIVLLSIGIEIHKAKSGVEALALVASTFFAIGAFEFGKAIHENISLNKSIANAVGNRSGKDIKVEPK